MTSNLNKFGPKIDAKFKSEFEGPILEFFGDFLRFGGTSGIFLKVWFGSAERGRPAKGRGKLKLSPLELKFEDFTRLDIRQADDGGCN